MTSSFSAGRSVGPSVDQKLTPEQKLTEAVDRAEMADADLGRAVEQVRALVAQSFLAVELATKAAENNRRSNGSGNNVEFGYGNRSDPNGEFANQPEPSNNIRFGSGPDHKVGSTNAESGESAEPFDSVSRLLSELGSAEARLATSRAILHDQKGLILRHVAAVPDGLVAKPLKTRVDALVSDKATASLNAVLAEVEKLSGPAHNALAAAVQSRQKTFIEAETWSRISATADGGNLHEVFALIDSVVKPSPDLFRNIQTVAAGLAQRIGVAPENFDTAGVEQKVWQRFFEGLAQLPTVEGFVSHMGVNETNNLMRSSFPVMPPKVAALKPKTAATKTAVTNNRGVVRPVVPTPTTLPHSRLARPAPDERAAS